MVRPDHRRGLVQDRGSSRERRLREGRLKLTRLLGGPVTPQGWRAHCPFDQQLGPRRLRARRAAQHRRTPPRPSSHVRLGGGPAGADEGPAPTLGDHHPVRLELAVDAGDRVDREPHVRGQRPHCRQAGSRTSACRTGPGWRSGGVPARTAAPRRVWSTGSSLTRSARRDVEPPAGQAGQHRRHDVVGRRRRTPVASPGRRPRRGRGRASGTVRRPRRPRRGRATRRVPWRRAMPQASAAPSGIKAVRTQLDQSRKSEGACLAHLTATSCRRPPLAGRAGVANAECHGRGEQAQTLLPGPDEQDHHQGDPRRHRGCQPSRFGAESRARRGRSPRWRRSRERRGHHQVDQGQAGDEDD